MVSVTSALPSTGPIMGTHNGTFHCDEVLACAMLRLLPAYSSASIVRTRDAAVLDACDVLVDVGGQYEAEKCKYDHHQRGFSEVMNELSSKTKLSSAGLIYRHYGMEVIKQIVGAESAECLTALYKKIYKSFVEEIDGNDNGVEIFDSGSRNYEVNTSLPNRVQMMNPQWNQDKGEDSANAAFVNALRYVGDEFVAHVAHCHKYWWPARDIVAKSLTNAANVHPSCQIVVLAQYVPYDSHLYSLEEEMDKRDVSKFIVYEEPNGDWRIKTVAVSMGSFTPRLSFPKTWGGLKGEELSKASGIPGCIFVHAGLFIGGNKTRDGAIQMALQTIGCK